MTKTAASYRGNSLTKSPTQTSNFLKQSFRALPTCLHSPQERADYIDETNHKAWVSEVTVQLAHSSRLKQLLVRHKSQFSNNNSSQEISNKVQF